MENGTERLKPCPFCGGAKICTEKSINLNYCDNCSAESNVERWNARPIEDALNKRIAELEAESERAKAIVSRLRDFLFDYTNLKISNSQDDRWWALVDKFDELTTESEK